MALVNLAVVAHSADDSLGLTREGSRNALWSAAPCTDCPKGGQIYTAPLR